MSWTLYVHTAKGRTTTLPAEPSDTLLKIKKKIQTQTGVPVHLQKLLFNGMQLDNDQATLIGCHVHNWAKILLLPQQAESEASSYDVAVKTLSGKNLMVQAKPSDTVEDVCIKVHQKEGIPLEQQQLIYGGKVLERDMPLNHYSIQRGSALHVICASSQRKILLRLPATARSDARMIPIMVLLNDTVECLSKSIAQRFKIPTNLQQLSCSGKRLKVDKQLSHYSIESGSVVDVQVLEVAAGHEPMASQVLFIKAPMGQLVRLECLPGDAVRSIKEKVYAKLGFEPEKQLLLLAGNPLEDDVTLNSYNISNESTLHLILRSERTDLVEIFVKTLTGKTVALTCSLTDTIKSIKTKMQETEAIVCGEQRLLLRGEPIDDATQLRDCNIETESTFYLTLKSPRFNRGRCILIKVMTSTGRQLELQVEKSSTVKEVKELIFASEKLPVECQNLFLGGIVLLDEVPLSRYGIKTNSMLSLQTKDSAASRYIYVRNMLGKNIAIEIFPTDKVQNLKSKISAKEGIPVHQQRLVFQGKLLDDETLLQHYDIDQESSLQLSLTAPEEALTSIFVRTLTGKTLTIEISPSAKVSELKKKVHRMEGLSPEQQRFILDGIELNDEATLDSYNLSTHTTLQLMIKAHESTLKDIFIRNPLGKTVAISVFLEERVSEIKAKISKKEGVPPAKQRLLFQGRELEDDRALGDYGIERESNLMLVLKESADCGKVSVKMLSGSIVSFNLQSNDTIASIKSAVQRLQGIPFSRQDLLNENRISLHDNDVVTGGSVITVALKPVSVSVLVSQYSPSARVKVISVENVTDLDSLLQFIEVALNIVPRSRLRLFVGGKMLTNDLCHLIEHGNVIILDVSDPAGDPLTGTFNGSNSHFQWRGSTIQVQLSARSPIRTITIQECSTSVKFNIPPSACLLSEVYELLCTHTQDDAATSAEVTIPILFGGGSPSGLIFFQASRTPSYWQCNLTPVYSFHAVRGGVFDAEKSLAKITVAKFNCFICVCYQPQH